MTRARVFRAAIVLGLVCVALIACVTVNVYFPAPAVQKAADQIVSEVRAPAKEAEESGQVPQAPAAPEVTPSPQSSFLGGFETLLAWAGPSVAHAQDVNVNITTPAIRMLKDSLKGRSTQLLPYYKKGALGENNQGFLEARNQQGLDLKQRAELNRLIGAENADRRALYEEIVKANNIDKGLIPQVAKLFANSWRSQAPSGSWVQKDDGGWSTK